MVSSLVILKNDDQDAVLVWYRSIIQSFKSTIEFSEIIIDVGEEDESDRDKSESCIGNNFEFSVQESVTEVMRKVVQYTNDEFSRNWLFHLRD
ncbi:hypothetical protein JTB14_009929 [Gonioctena quinquepunctata]|nr:hypothetical protein JTB14_009929 [Gonioctena quinquepunctata]